MLAIRTALKFSPPVRLADRQHRPPPRQHFAGAGPGRLAPVAHLRHAGHALHADCCRRGGGAGTGGGGEDGADCPDTRGMG